MLFFAMISVATIWFQTESNSWITWGVWLVFFIDFLYRFFNSEKKWDFIKKNPFLIIALIPLDSIFQLARVARLIHMFRLKTITKHFTTPFIEKLKTKRITYLIPIGFGLVFLSVIPLYHLEPSIPTYKDAFLGSIASLIFFGTSEINPTTITGNIIVVLLTVFGVIIHGVLISYFFSFILNLNIVKKLFAKISKDEDVEG